MACAESATSTDIPWSVRDLIPQSGNMVLLDKVLAVGEEFILTESAVQASNLFCSGTEGGIPAWMGIEFMAQTIAAYSGYWRLRQGLAVDLGFLLGTRHYESMVAVFPTGMTLRIRAEKEIESLNGMSVFDCRIDAEHLLARAKLNVFLPVDSKTYLSERGL